MSKKLLLNKTNIQGYISRLNTIIVKEITLGHKHRWHATTKNNPEFTYTILLDFIDCLIVRFLRTDTAVCDNHQRLGNIGDGGWDICMVAPFKPIDPCLVYSFG